MALADDVREYCKTTYVEQARQKKQKTITIRSGDVHSALNYKNRYPLVCSALGSNRFEEMCNLR
jgi:5-methylcytosine-specific restriction protein B